MSVLSLFYAYNVYNFYIKQYCYESMSEVDNKTVIFLFFFVFRIKSHIPLYVIVYTLIVEKNLIFNSFQTAQNTKR